MKPKALLLIGETIDSTDLKIVKALFYNSSKFKITGFISHSLAGQNPDELFLDQKESVPIYPNLRQALNSSESKPQYLIIGLYNSKELFPSNLKAFLIDAIQQGLHLVNCLSQLLFDDEELIQLSQKHKTQLVDLKLTRPNKTYKKWQGDLLQLKTPQIAVLGTDNCIGTLQTVLTLNQISREAGIRSEIVHSSPAGWLAHDGVGFIFDSVPNQYLAGEIEQAILRCHHERAPELIIVEGNSALRHPMGTGGSELLVSARIQNVILQHAPGRKFMSGLNQHKFNLPSLKSEMNLIEAYGARVLAVFINHEGLQDAALGEVKFDIHRNLKLPAFNLENDNPKEILNVLKTLLNRSQAVPA